MIRILPRKIEVKKQKCKKKFVFQYNISKRRNSGKAIRLLAKEDKTPNIARPYVSILKYY